MSHNDLTITWRCSTSPHVSMVLAVTQQLDTTAVIAATSSVPLGEKDKSILADLLQTAHTTLRDMSQRNSQPNQIPVSWVDILSSDECPSSRGSALISSLKSLPPSSNIILREHWKTFQQHSSTEADSFHSGGISAENYASKSEDHQMPRKQHSIKSKRTCSLCAKLRSMLRALSRRKS